MSRGLSDNLRHLRLFLALHAGGSLSVAAAQCAVSQPAASQALAALERRAGGPLFMRRMGGALTARGHALHPRVLRAFSILDQAFADLSPRLGLTASAAQLHALIATVENGGFASAAARLGLKPPSVQRCVGALEAEAGRALFTRASQGMRAGRAAQALARAARLALAELAQAEAELAAIDGVTAGPIRVGALPLARAAWL
uniref:helix-turn-helix domain-containing protein n=1 Tax=Roseicyclus sp. TaxID=1914329 RepID=UPI003F6C62CD